MMLYQALSGSASQNAVIRAAAQDRLSPSLRADLETLLREYKKVGGMRNDVAHGQWMLSEDYPNALVWTDTRANLLAHSAFWAEFRDKQTEDEQLEFAAGWTPNPGTRLLYFRADFEEIKDRMRMLTIHMLHFNRRCMIELGE